jgi:hypothetical protein
MGLSSRYYLFAEDGVHRIAKRVVDGLVQGIDALPNYASTTQKAAAVTIENDAKGVARIINAVGEFWHFDEVGKINKSLQQAAWVALDRLAPPSSSDQEAVVDLGAKLKQKQWDKEHRWKLSKADLDLIAADLDIDGFSNERARLRMVRGVAPKRDSLTHEARYAVEEIQSLLITIDSQLEGLSEVALKGLVSEANQRAANRNEPLWTGIEAAAARKREILARHRTGKGAWYAVIEGLRYDPTSRGREVFTITFEKCSSLKAAEAAARRLLVEKAEHFSKWTGIEPRVYTELEWSPRKKGEAEGEGPFF